MSKRSVFDIHEHCEACFSSKIGQKRRFSAKGMSSYVHEAIEVALEATTPHHMLTDLEKLSDMIIQIQYSSVIHYNPHDVLGYFKCFMQCANGLIDKCIDNTNVVVHSIRKQVEAAIQKTFAAYFEQESKLFAKKVNASYLRDMTFSDQMLPLIERTRLKPYVLNIIGCTVYQHREEIKQIVQVNIKALKQKLPKVDFGKTLVTSYYQAGKRIAIATYYEGAVYIKSQTACRLKVVTDPVARPNDIDIVAKAALRLKAIDNAESIHVLCKQRLTLTEKIEATRLDIKGQEVLLKKGGQLVSKHKTGQGIVSVQAENALHSVGHIASDTIIYAIAGKLYIGGSKKNTQYWSAEKSILIDIKGTPTPSANKQDNACVIDGVIQSKGSIKIQANGPILLTKKGHCTTELQLYCNSPQHTIGIRGTIHVGKQHIKKEIKEETKKGDTKISIQKKEEEKVDITAPIQINFHCVVLTVYETACIKNMGHYMQWEDKSGRTKYKSLKGGNLIIDSNRTYMSGKTNVRKGVILIGANHCVVLGPNLSNWTATQKAFRT